MNNETDIGVPHEQMAEEVPDEEAKAVRGIIWELVEPTLRTVIDQEGDCKSVELETPYGNARLVRNPDLVEAVVENTQVESYLRYVLGHTGDDVAADVPGWNYLGETSDGEGFLLRIDRDQVYTELL